MDRPFVKFLTVTILLCSCSSRHGVYNSESFISGIEGIIPKEWTCTVITTNGEMGHPHGLEEPVFRLDFNNTAKTITDNLDNKKVSPHLRLHFYKITGKSRILKIIDQEMSYSWDIPLYFDETSDYIILTSPGWINHGIYTEEAKKIYAPLEMALKDYCKAFRSNSNTSR